MDLFDDIFQNKSSLQEILREVQLQLSLKDFRNFMVYRERKLASVPLEKLRLSANEPTLSVSLSRNSSTNRSKSKSVQEMPEHYKRSGNDQDRSEESAKDTAQSMELP